MGGYMMNHRTWRGKWISAPGCPANEAPLFRKKLFINAVGAEPRVYISGVGFYVMYINGKRMGDELLSPAFSAYDQRVYYQAYDVASYLEKGENRVEILLGNGWFNEQQENAWGYERVK